MEKIGTASKSVTTGIEEKRKAPILLPDYRGKAVLARMIDVLQ